MVGRTRRIHRPLLAAAAAVLAGAVLACPPVQSLWGRLRWTDREALWTASVFLLLLGLGLIAWAVAGSGRPAADVRSALRRRPHLASAALAVLAPALVLAVLEAALAIAAGARHPPVEEQSGTYTQDFFQADSMLGYRPARPMQATSRKRVGGRTIYDVTYTIDGLGRRVTPAGEATAGGADAPLVLFFGCSVTFGEGIQDDETLPHEFALARPDAEVLNYGFCGYGPQHVLAMLEDGRLDSLLAGRDVVAVYTFIDAHVARSIGSLIVVTAWGIDMPCYTLAAGGRVVRRGSFRSSRPVRNWAYALACHSRLLRHFGVDLPVRRREHYQLTARILAESAQRIAAGARSSRFYVVLYPTARTGAHLKSELAGTGIRVLDYSGLWQAADTTYAMPHDWHPTPAANRLLAARLARDVDLGMSDRSAAAAVPSAHTPR